MKLNTNSWHYKLWESTFAIGTPTQTDLCRYCHRVFWGLVFLIGKALLVIYLVGMLGFLLGWGMIYHGFILHTKMAFAITGGIVGTIALIAAYTFWLGGSSSKKSDNLANQWLQAHKQKVCPLVEFDEE